MFSSELSILDFRSSYKKSVLRKKVSKCWKNKTMFFYQVTLNSTWAGRQWERLLLNPLIKKSPKLKTVDTIWKHPWCQRCLLIWYHAFIHTSGSICLYCMHFQHSVGACAVIFFLKWWSYYNPATFI